MNKILFILKKRQKGEYGSWSYTEGELLDSGLLISARQVVSMLETEGFEVKLVQVTDNNDIDKEVSIFKPKYVFIEAFWVIPEKFDILKKLHPGVEWVIRCHSKTDFLSHEGTVFGWTLDYISKGIYVACNSVAATEDFKELSRIVGIDSNKVIYLPNYYDTINSSKSKSLHKILCTWVTSGGIHSHYISPRPKILGELNIGCFGAIRPLKNHMAQALAAINVADYLGLSLKFHISGNRIEGPVGGILKALRALFGKTPGHTLVETPWLPHLDFTKYIGKMDMNIQVSLSETFNIVCADSVDMGVPVVVSNQIPWVSEDYIVNNPTDVQDITSTMILVWNASGSEVLIADQLDQLDKYCEISKSTWVTALNKGLVQ